MRVGSILYTDGGRIVAAMAQAENAGIVALDIFQVTAGTPPHHCKITLEAGTFHRLHDKHAEKTLQEQHSLGTVIDGFGTSLPNPIAPVVATIESFLKEDESGLEEETEDEDVEEDDDDEEEEGNF